MNIAVIQKCPSNINYERDFNIPNLEVFQLASQKVARLLVRDIDLKISYDEGEFGDPDTFYVNKYDWIILVGSEAVKQFTKVTAVSDHTGRLVEGKRGEANLIASISPAMLAFKPETKPVFEHTVKSIHQIINGSGNRDITDGEYEPIQCPNRANEYLRWVLSQDQIKVFALDSETTALQARHGYMLGFSISHKKHQGVYIDADCVDEEFGELLQEAIEKKECVLHNAKFDMHFFKYHLNIDFMRAKQLHDTMIQHYLLDERQGTHGLKSLTMKYGSLGDYDAGLETFKKEYCSRHGLKNEDFNYGLIPWEIISLYAAKDTAATLELHEKFLPLIEANPRLRSCYYSLMLPALMFLTRMEDRGIPISKPRLLAAKQILEKDLEQLKTDLYSFKEVGQLEAEQGSKFNPNSTPQLRKLLFDYVGLPPTGKLTGTGAISTDAEVLEELAKLHPIPKLIHDVRKKTKLLNTYINKLLLVIDKDGRVRTGFNLTSTTSGRLSSSGNFNFQQLPARDYLIKGCLKAPEGYKFVAHDGETAEVWVAAVLSQDKAMMKLFQDIRREPKVYPDFHSSVAHLVFNLKCNPSEVKKLFPELRQAAKAVTFSILYGSGAANVAETINLSLMEAGQEPTCTVEDARGYFTTYFQRFPQLKRWIDNCHSEIKQNGYIYNFFGRKRRLHNIKSVDKGTSAGEVRSGFNAIIQSTSSDILLLGAMHADLEIMEKNLDIQIIGLVHDSIVAIVKDGLVDTYNEILVRNVQADRGLMIPGCPMGISSDTEESGSIDYSGGKMAIQYPEVALI